MITLTTEQAQQIEEALAKIAFEAPSPVTVEALAAIAFDVLPLIRAARSQEPAEQPVSQEYQDHLVNQSFDWAAMAAKHQFMEGYRIGLAEMREKCAKVMESGVLGHGECAAAIRAINFEGDTGFRLVSEMIAEHKQDPKKAAAIEKAKTRKATRAEKIAMPGVYEVPVEQAEQEPVGYWQGKFSQDGGAVLYEVPQASAFGYHYPNHPVYAAPVRTKDLK